MGDRFCIRKRQTSSWSQDRLQDAWYRGYSESHDRAVCGSLHERFGVVKSFETMDEYHLIKQFSKPQEGEFVPITFIEFKRKWWAGPLSLKEAFISGARRKKQS